MGFMFSMIRLLLIVLEPCFDLHGKTNEFEHLYSNHIKSPLDASSILNHVNYVIPGPHRAAQPKTSVLRILWKYRAEISIGWSCWLQITPPSSSHSSSFNQLKSQPCISGEYVGLMFLVTRTARVFGVTYVSIMSTQFLGGHQ